MNFGIQLPTQEPISPKNRVIFTHGKNTTYYQSDESDKQSDGYTTASEPGYSKIDETRKKVKKLRKQTKTSTHSAPLEKTFMNQGPNIPYMYGAHQYPTTYPAMATMPFLQPMLP